MARQKRYQLVLNFKTKEDLEEWATGTTKRPYVIVERDALHEHCERGIYLTKKFNVKAFLDKDAPAEEELHPVAQGLRISSLG
jgi:antibiotic biosynthesis monooxygenase (ABM) superfamily enzyme